MSNEKRKDGEEKLLSWQNILGVILGAGMLYVIAFIANRSWFDTVMKIGITIVLIFSGILLLIAYLEKRIRRYIRKCIDEYIKEKG